MLSSWHKSICYIYIVVNVYTGRCLQIAIHNLENKNSLYQLLYMNIAIKYHTEITSHQLFKIIFKDIKYHNLKRITNHFKNDKAVLNQFR